jgi:hypothetical protein
MDTPSNRVATRQRPLPVTLAAWYEFAKAAFLLYAFYGVCALHNASAAAGQDATDPFIRDPFVLILPIFAATVLIAGVGLLRLQAWARHMLLFQGILGVPWLPRTSSMHFSLNNTFDYDSVAQYLPRTVMLWILMIDSLIYAVMVWYPDVAEAFGEQSGDPYYDTTLPIDEPMESPPSFEDGTVPPVNDTPEPIPSMTDEEHAEFLEYLKSPNRKFMKAGRSVNEEFEAWQARHAK